MHPQLQLFRSTQAYVARTLISKSPHYQIPVCLRIAQQRSITADEKPLPKAEQQHGPGPNQEQLPHVSEEAAATGKITGESGPEINQGTPVQEILKRDKEGQDKAPKIMQEEATKSSSTGTRSFSTSTRRPADVVINSQGSEMQTEAEDFRLPQLPLPSNANMKYRYEPVIKQVTNLLMREGKLSVAQRNMAMILTHLRTASPPAVNPNRPLLPGAPPASHLPLNPVLYLTLAIDSVAPVLRIRSQKGAAGGGVALPIPVPLGLKQRRRQAVQWILDAASKRETLASGRGGFAQKVAEEIIAVVEGRSGVWDRRGGVHKLGVSARANVSWKRRR